MSYCGKKLISQGEDLLIMFANHGNIDKEQKFVSLIYLRSKIIFIFLHFHIWAFIYLLDTMQMSITFKPYIPEPQPWAI